ncbi:MAG: (Na+)-NQR maturation NqrM [Burkholderiaceae bacterium]
MEILLAIVLFLVFFAAMALGVILKGKPLQGSCGGAATLMGEKSCTFCGRDASTCERKGGEQKVVNVLRKPT